MTEPFRMFDVRVDRLERLSPSFLRVTFTGDDLHEFADNGFDQRVKLFLPVPEHGMTYLPKGPDWYQRWRELDPGRRNVMRTYTARTVRPRAGEVDVDVVMHPDGGPAARWAEQVRPGDVAALLGPNGVHEGPHGGLEFRPPAGTGCVLIAGDETAVPAICAILERIPAHLAGEVLMEVPLDADVLPITAPANIKVTWLARNGGERGAELVPAVRAAAARLLPPLSATPDSFEDVDVDTDELWEVPQDTAGHDPLYAWLAGEAGVIKTLRRHLVAERGMDRRAVAFMGYWRHGRAENTG
ncbi:siderophore-interacting protein [Nonomuraea salmonea]|uniref:Siderophore-interacting protein n=1 Tax=Nonomuraea salmonea TaxID=46181 RepID=A0ABV5NU10_9ACTN